MKQETDSEAEKPTTTTGRSPLVAEESDDIILSVDDEEPAAAEAQEHDHEAEIFAGFGLESNGIRFRGPKSGKIVRGGLLFVLLPCAHDVSASSILYPDNTFLL